MIPRWIHHLYADLLGYFWLLCPLCGHYFGGHEKLGILQTKPHGGMSVCSNCIDKAEEINQTQRKERDANRTLDLKIVHKDRSDETNEL